MRECRRPLASGLALPLLLSACSSGAQPNNVAAQSAPPAKASPTEAAQQRVREQVGRGEALRFAAAEVFDSEGATIVCGRFALGGQAEQRYIAIGDEDVFLESQMEPGHMDQAASEYCRAGAGG